MCIATWWKVRRKHSATVRARRLLMDSCCALCVAQTEFSALFFLVSYFLHVIFRRTRKTIATGVYWRRHVCPSVLWNRAAPTGRVFMFSALTKTCPSISILFNFGNMCTCIYCVLYCLYCVFCIVSFMYIYSYLFCLYWCKDYCHRVTTKLQ